MKYQVISIILIEMRTLDNPQVGGGQAWEYLCVTTKVEYWWKLSAEQSGSM